MGLERATCIDDLRLMHRRRVPRAFFEYADRGSYSEQTLKRNCADLQSILLRQRVLVDVADRDLSIVMMGERWSLPFALGPVGLSGLQHGNGEIEACCAAQSAGIPFCLSTMSICSIEDVAAAVSKPFWFQLYVMKDRGFVRELIGRAATAGCSTLVLTVDLQVLGQRRADVKNGMTIPPRLTLRNLFDLGTKPQWLLGVLASKRKTFGNLYGYLHDATSVNSLIHWVSTQFDEELTWSDVEWVRDLWPGKLVIKGIMDPGDATRAARIGADAVVVSNHGGRQLDGAPSSVSALPGIVDAVGHELQVLFDGGVRSGQDVVRALALGASACLLGRAYIYGLGAYGRGGVARAIEIIGSEIDVTMALMGVRKAAELDQTVLI